MKKRAFTLAEIMIVLSVIAILTAILLPSARNAMPNEKVMKFKKGHNTLYSAVSELVNSDKYYLNGDLGTKVDGEELSEWNDKPEHQQYFCKTLSEVLAIKFADCTTLLNGTGGGLSLTLVECSASNYTEQMANCNGKAVENERMQNRKELLDTNCRKKPHAYNVTQKQLITNDDIWYYDISPKTTFGVKVTGDVRLFSPPSQTPPTFYDDAGMDYKYKYFCMDIDGVPDNATEDNCVNECPFGYGIRADGKILNGARADEWLNKSIQEK